MEIRFEDLIGNAGMEKRVIRECQAGQGGVTTCGGGGGRGSEGKEPMQETVSQETVFEAHLKIRTMKQEVEENEEKNYEEEEEKAEKEEDEEKEKEEKEEEEEQEEKEEEMEEEKEEEEKVKDN
ncbi:hypothetical protein Pmani_036698 [Petrolisthes manimaculis]|uniref:Uncharacterized protein n=1 Tax=Petrolisthes manimaculis TaxID=1843537 RepID=A0AAE1NJM9_9EUCA|nr:hypothetical protein Pmani_036698 [Petrolisthes manimaculis]